jgi:biopolymer transport protein ExbD
VALGGLNKGEDAAPMAEINVTPMVDVMLVLLVIFLVTAPMLTQAVKLALPNETATQIADENPITLSVNAEGQYFWDSEPLTEVQLDQRLQAAAARNAKQPLHLRADTSVPYGKISKILALSQKHGLTAIGFITQPAPASKN